MENGFCYCGCGEKTKKAKHSDNRYGDRKGEHRRFIRGHFLRRSPHPYIVEDRGYKTPCWTWQWNKSNGGYALTGAGQVNKGESRYVHRRDWTRIHGPVPPGMELDHLCRVRSCINPDHLEPVTKKENARRGSNTKLTPELIQEMFRLKLGGMRVRVIAEMFGIHKSYLEALCQRNGVWVKPRPAASEPSWTP
jgi:HNH endonuclease